MFDCVDKKSKEKEESYNYEYKIKTSQNIDRAEEENENNKTNYELSDDGICPQNCSYCISNKICIKCKENSFRTKIGENIVCLLENELKEGYYLNDSIYYQCIEGCANCSNQETCINCKFGFTKNSESECIGSINNCEEYTDINTCKKCIKNFAFEEEERGECKNINNFEQYYSKDGGISYYLCDGEGEAHIQNCKKCNYNDNILECNECKDGYIILNDESNKCYSESIINNNKNKYYYINDTHVYSCSKGIKNCEICESGNKCIKCENNYYLLNEITNKCYNITDIGDIEEYYLNDDETIYYSCRNIKYNSFPNCKECSGNNTCSLCAEDFSFINGQKDKCIYINSPEYKNYCYDPEDHSNIILCEIDDPNCLQFSQVSCNLCSEKYGLFPKENKCISLTNYYDELKENIMYFLVVDLSYNDYSNFLIFYDFTIPYDFNLYIPVSVKVRTSFRNLQENDTLLFFAYLNYYDYNSKIGLFKGSPSEYLYRNDEIIDMKINYNNIIDNKSNIIKYNFNNTYKEYINSDESYENIISMLSINAFKIKGVLLKGENNFTLILNEDIYIEKEINIKLIEFGNKNNIIEAKCILSKNNFNKIPCEAEIETNKEYYIKDYFYFNKTNGELISVSIDKPSKELISTIKSTDGNSSSGNKISTGVIIVIVLGCIILVSIIIGFIIISIIIKKKNVKIVKFGDKNNGINKISQYDNLQ